MTGWWSNGSTGDAREDKRDDEVGVFTGGVGGKRSEGNVGALIWKLVLVFNGLYIVSESAFVLGNVCVVMIMIRLCAKLINHTTISFVSSVLPETSR